MKRKVLWAVGIGILVLVLIMGVARYIDVIRQIYVQRVLNGQ